jgi:hypothetical protein
VAANAIISEDRVRSSNPIVDVTEFGMLVRLAERYGLLVLHRSRSGTDTYVVQDEGATYRYSTQIRQGDVTTRSAAVGDRRQGSTHART